MLKRLHGYVYRDPQDPNGTRAAPTAPTRGLSCLRGDLRMRRLLADWLATTGVFSSFRWTDPVLLTFVSMVVDSQGDCDQTRCHLLCAGSGIATARLKFKSLSALLLLWQRKCRQLLVVVETSRLDILQPSSKPQGAANLPGCLASPAGTTSILCEPKSLGGYLPSLPRV